MIRKATNDDLFRIAKCHIDCFPDSFSTVLGKAKSGYLLMQFYKEYLEKAPELFLVDEENGEIIGFCMGYYLNENEYQKTFVKNNFFRIFFRTVFLLLTFNKKAWKKVFSFFKRKKEPKIITQVEERIDEGCDLLSICVKKEYRGKGRADCLIKSYLEVVRREQKKFILLNVDINNKRACSFYEKNGYTLHREAEQDHFTYYKRVIDL